MTDIEIQKPDPMEQVVRAIMSTLDAQMLTRKTKVLTRVDLVKYVAAELKAVARKKYEEMRKRYNVFKSRECGTEHKDAALKKVAAVLKAVNKVRNSAKPLEAFYMGYHEGWFENMLKQTDKKLEPHCKVRVKIATHQYRSMSGEEVIYFTFKMPMSVSKQQDLREEYGREFLLLERYNDLAYGHTIDRERAARLVLKCTPEGAAINNMIDTMSERLDEALACLPGEKLKELSDA